LKIPSVQTEVSCSWTSSAENRCTYLSVSVGDDEINCHKVVIKQKTGVSTNYLVG
jgi:hypothetical protein